MNILRSFSKNFWDRDFWLPQNYDWDEIVVYNQFNLTNIIIIPTIVALNLFFIRIYFEKYMLYFFN